MTDQTPTTECAPAKTIIRPNIKNYVRAKSGAGKRTHRIDDFTARSLDGKTVEQVLKGGAKLGVDVAKWSHLNPGQQRMLVGNAIRPAVRPIPGGRVHSSGLRLERDAVAKRDVHVSAAGP